MNETLKNIARTVGIILLLLFVGGYIQQYGIVSKTSTEKAIFNFSYNCNNK